MYQENHTIKLKYGRILGFSEYGDPKGKPLFFFHGWPSSRLHAKRTAGVAKKLHIRVISPDRPGYGLSDFQPNRTLLDWPDDVAQLADQLKIRRFAVAGVSGGGPYAAVCAYKIPDRISKAGIVVGLAPTYIPGILEGLLWINKVGWANFRRFPLLTDMSAFLGWLETKLLPNNLSALFLTSKADKAISDTAFRKASFLSRKEAFKHGFKATAWDLKLYSNNWGFDLKKIKVPTFLWYGEADKNVSLKMGKYYTSQIKGSKLTVYPGEGHYCQLNHAEEIYKVLCLSN